jgi:hypothetical protein
MNLTGGRNFFGGEGLPPEANKMDLSLLAADFDGKSS